MLWRHPAFCYWVCRSSSQASLVAQLVKNPPAVREIWVRSLGWEDPLEKGKATHSSILAWRIPWTVQSMGSQESDTTERLHFHTFIVRQGLSIRDCSILRVCDSPRRKHTALRGSPVKTDQSDSHSQDPGGQAYPLTKLWLPFRVSWQPVITRHFEKASSMQETKTTEEN